MLEPQAGISGVKGRGAEQSQQPVLHAPIPPLMDEQPRRAVRRSQQRSSGQSGLKRQTVRAPGRLIAPFAKNGETPVARPF